MTGQKLLSALTMIRKFTQKRCDFRGEVELLNMKMTDLIDDWFEVIDIYNEEKKALMARKKQQALLTPQAPCHADTESSLNILSEKPDLKPADKQ